MMSFKKNGFTLIEILATLILLAVISIISVPIINTVIEDSKTAALNQIVNTLETAALNYSVNNELGYSSKTKTIEVNELKKLGYLKNEAIVNPVTDKELEGCILYRWDDNYKQYQFNYEDSCEIKDLSLTIEPINADFNEYGWAKEDFYVEIKTTGLSYNYCISDKKCSPKINVGTQTGNALVSLESDSIYVCAYAVDGNVTSDTVCSLPYKLDKTKPTAGTININGTVGENNWFTTNVTIETVDGNDDLSGHLTTIVDTNSITTNENGKVVTVSTTDKAGNTSTRNYTIKIDKTEPKVTIAKSVVSNKNVLTATTTPSTTTSNYSYTWYKNGSIISGATGSSYTTTDSGTFKVVVKTGAGKVATSNEITINSYTVTYNLNGGTGSITNTAKVEDINTNITSTKPTRSGYTFVGWGSSASDTSVDYASGAIYIGNKNITLYAIWKQNYNGVENKQYAVGEKVVYEGIDFIVVSSTNDTVTLITANNVSTGIYGNSTNWKDSTVKNYLNTTWVNNNSKINSEIQKGAIVYNTSTDSYVRLIEKSELTSAMKNGSNTNFWTMTANGSSIWYALSNASTSYTKYTTTSTSGSCYSGSGAYSSSNLVQSYSTQQLKNTTENTIVLPNSSSAISSYVATPTSGSCYDNYSSTTSQSCGTTQACDQQCYQTNCREVCSDGYNCGLPPGCTSCGGGVSWDVCYDPNGCPPSAPETSGDYVCTPYHNCNTYCDTECQSVNCREVPSCQSYTTYYATGNKVNYTNYSVSSNSSNLGYRAVITVKKR